MNFIKKMAKKIFLPKISMLPDREGIYKKLGGMPLVERTLRYGTELKTVNCLNMEAAPGVTETVVKLLESVNLEAAILDYGCGQHQSLYLKKMGFKNIHSCDVLNFSGPNFTRIDPASKTLPFADRQFDIVIASELLEHIWSPWLLMEEFKRIAGRRIIITTPNVVSLQSKKIFSSSGYFQWFEPKDFSYHVSPIFYWQMEEFCKSHQLKQVATYGNHTILGLESKGGLLDYAEALIFDIAV